jgi:hypothetical protein
MCCYLLLFLIKFQTKYQHSIQKLIRMTDTKVKEQQLLIDDFICSMNNLSIK